MAKFCILALVAFIIVLAVGPVLVSCQAAKPSANIVDATVASVATAVSNNNWNILSKIFTQFRSARMISLKEKRDANFVRVCETGSIQKIDGFIKASYSIDVADKDEGSTCLMKATAKDRHNIVAHLLQKGASLTQLNSKGENVLQLGMKTHSVWSPIVDMLISHAQNELSQSDLAAFLNNQGISPETASAPAIFIAIRYERWEIVRRLLSSKRALPMDLTVSSNKYCNNKSPLMVAMETSYTPIDVVELILKKGSSNLNHKDLQKNTPLFSACSSSKSNNKLLQMLLMYDKDMYESSINPNIHNLTGATPLYTCAFHSLESAKTLVSHFKSLHHHLDLSLVDEEGKSLLHHAVEKNRLDVVEFVLQFAKESGQLARILAQQIPDSGNTALHLSSKNAAMLSLILAYDLKVSVNIGNSLGMTALMLQVEKIGETGVVSNDHVPEVIKILVEKGDADLSIRNKNGKSASDIAYGGGLEGLNEYLSKVLK